MLTGILSGKSLMQLNNEQLEMLRAAAKDEETFEAILSILGEVETKSADEVQEIQQLQEREIRYRTLAEMTTDYAYAYRMHPDGSYELEWIEGAFAHITGYTPEEWQSGNLNNYIHPDDQHLAEKHTAILSAGQAYIDEYRIITKDGQVRWLHDHAQAIVDPETGHVVHVIGATRDITREKSAEHALQENESRFRLLAEHASDLITIQAFDGVTRYISPSSAALLGYHPNEIIGQRAGELIHPEDIDLIKEAFRALARTGQPQTYTFRVQHREGHWLWVEASSVGVVDPVSQKVIEVHSTTRDVTSKKLIAEERERLIGELEAYNHTVAHDLKNPLNTILGFANILEDFHDTFSLEERVDLYHKIVRSGNKMMNIIEELLLLSGLRVNEVVIEPLDMTQIVREVIERLNFMIEDYRPDFIIPSKWPVAMGQKQWVEEIWANYLSNAMKYGGKPPYIEIGSDAPRNGMVRFWVRDNGLGLHADDQSRIFVPFTRLDRLRARGHGLGLSIVQRVAERLGGQVGVESTFGDGCLFYFTLPQA